MENSTKNSDNKQIGNLIIKLWELIKNTAESVNELKHENAELLNRNLYLNKAIENKDSGEMELIQKNHILENSVQSQKDEIANLKANIDANNSEIIRLKGFESKYVDLTSNYQLLEQKFLIMKEKASFITTISKELTEEKEKSAQLEDKIKILNDENIVLFKEKENFELAQKEIARKNQKLFEKTQNIESLHSNLAEAESTILKFKNLEKDYQNLLMEKIKIETILKDFENQKAQERQTFYKNLDTLNQELNFIKSEVDIANTMLMEKEILISENDNIIYNLKADSEDKDRLIESMLLENDNLKNSFHEIENFLKEKNDTIENLEKYKELYAFNESKTETLEQEIEKYKAIVINNENEINDLKAINEKISNEINNLKVNEELLQVRISELEEHISEANIIISDNIKQIEELKNLNKSIVNSNDAIINDLKLNNENLKNNINEFLPKEESLNNRIVELEEHISDANIIISENLNNLEVMKKSLEDKNYKLNNLNMQIAELDELKSQMIKKETEFAYKYENLNKEIFDLKFEIEVKEEAIIELNKKISELESFSNNLIEKESNLYNKYQLVLSEKDILGKNIDSLIEKSNITQAAYEEAKTLNDTLQHQNKKLAENANTLINKIDDLEFDKIKTVENANSLLREIEEISEEKKDLFLQLETLKKEREDELVINNLYQEKIASLHSTMENLNDEIQQLELSKEEYSKKIIDLESNQIHFENYKNEIEMLKEQVENATEDANKLQVKIDELKSIISNLSQKNISLEAQIIDLKEKIKSSKNNETNLQLFESTTNKNEELENQLAIKEKQIQNYESEIGRLTNDLKLNQLNSDKFRERADDLEELLKTRYEQIKILESQLNNEIEKHQSFNKLKKEYIQKIDSYIDKIDIEISKK